MLWEREGNVRKKAMHSNGVEMRLSVCLKGKLVFPIRSKESFSSVLVGVNIETRVGNENGESCVNKV